MKWHVIAGFGVAGLLVLRLYLGVLGSATSRFANFLRGPRAVIDYLRGKGEVPVGHSPLGGWSVAALLTFLIVTTAFGLFSSDEDGLDAGPFASNLSFDQTHLASSLHNIAFECLIALIVLHIATNLVYLARRRNLVWPMVTGVKWSDKKTTAPKFVHPLVAAIGLILAACTFAFLWRLA